MSAPSQRYRENKRIVRKAVEDIFAETSAGFGSPVLTSLVVARLPKQVVDYLQRHGGGVYNEVSGILDDMATRRKLYGV